VRLTKAAQLGVPLRAWPAPVTPSPISRGVLRQFRPSTSTSLIERGAPPRRLGGPCQSETDRGQGKPTPWPAVASQQGNGHK
jgi:hypothetical protein